MAALAARADLEARLGRTLTTSEDQTRADALLDDASAAVRAYTGQTFEAGTSSLRVRARGRAVRLPLRPVTDVTAVTDVDGNEIGFDWYAGSSLSIDAAPLGGWVIVSYAHGGVVPDVVKAIVCQVAARAFGTKPEQSGYTSESVGGYSYSVGSVAAAGAVGLLDAEKSALDAFRVVGTSVVLG